MGDYFVGCGLADGTVQSPSLASSHYMGTLLYQWSTAAQLVSVLMITIFYATLARSVRRSEVSLWAWGWAWNLFALGATVSYWFITPPDGARWLLRASFFGGKAAYAILLVHGAICMRRPGDQWLTPLKTWLVVAGATVVGAFALHTIDGIGVAAQGPMGILFIWCGITLIASRGISTTWLGFGFLARGTFALIEAAAYSADMLPQGSLSPDTRALVENFLGAHSSIDLAGEWLLALGGVLAVTKRTQTEMESANADLLSVQEQLRNIADRDPLTGLVNRRALPAALRAVFEDGASLAFFDLDGFKAINDTHGHAVGDKCLLRFATALQRSFRPEDTIVRYAGDEFLAVCGGMDISTAEARVAAMREWLLAEPEPPKIDFSAGIVALASHENAEEAIEAADRAMYENKKFRARERMMRQNTPLGRLSGTFAIPRE